MSSKTSGDRAALTRDRKVGRMIQFTITERQARYIKFAVQSDAEVLSNGDFEDDYSNQSKDDAEAVISLIDAALLTRAITPIQEHSP